MNDHNLSMYLTCFNELEKINKTLSYSFPNISDVYNHKIGVFKIFRMLLLNYRFIYETSEISSQQVVMTLARMTIDHYSILYLLSCNSTRKEQSLRYYLYLIDSLNNRVNTINDFSNNFSEMDSEILKGNERSNLHDKNVIDNILKIIKDQGLALSIDDSVVKDKNWKYQSDYPAKNKKHYSWQELYNIAKIPAHFSKAIQNHFSSFTHGLGMTILYAEDRPDSTIHVYEFITLLQALTGKIMLLNFKEELKNLELRNDFVESGERGWKEWS